VTPAVHLDPRLIRHATPDRPGPHEPPPRAEAPAVLGMAAESRKPRTPPCVHCGRWPASRRRGLCNSCYADKTLRAATPTVNSYGRRGVATTTPSAQPAKATQAQPGGRRKLQVLIARAEAGEELWHVNDLSARV
jgi:hypothetical protein